MDQCSICLDEFTDRVSLDNCTHTYCKGCIVTWCKNNSSCPDCRSLIGTITDSKGEKTEIEEVDPESDTFGLSTIDNTSLFLLFITLRALSSVAEQVSDPRPARTRSRRRSMRSDPTTASPRRSERPHRKRGDV